MHSVHFLVDPCCSQYQRNDCNGGCGRFGGFNGFAGGEAGAGVYRVEVALFVDKVYLSKVVEIDESIQLGIQM